MKHLHTHTHTPNCRNLHSSLLHVFSPLFQPVKMPLNLDSAILPINNPSGFVSTANLISRSLILFHPRRGEKYRDGQGQGLSLRTLLRMPLELTPLHLCFLGAPALSQAPLTFLFSLDGLRKASLASPRVLCQRPLVPPPLVVFLAWEFC